MEYLEISAFNKSCDELINSNYILFDVKLNALIKEVKNDEKITNIVLSCTQNYNFNESFKTFVFHDNSGINFQLPTEDNDIVALVYSLLEKFALNEINLNDFLSQIGGDGDINQEKYYKFINFLLLPFKNSINTIYAKRHVIENEKNHQNNIYTNLRINIRLIVNNIDAYKLKDNDKDEFLMLLNSLFKACEDCNKSLVFSLMIALDYFTKFHKKCRIAYSSLEDCFVKND